MCNYQSIAKTTRTSSLHSFIMILFVEMKPKKNKMTWMKRKYEEEGL
jgi:hypothetical protein